MRILLILLICTILYSCAGGLYGKRSSSKVIEFEPIRVVTIHEGSFNAAPCEPTISINPSDDTNLVAGSVLNNVYVSNDSGITWHKSKLSSTYGVYGDPVIRFTNNGNVLYSHLSNPAGRAYASPEFLDRIVIQKSRDNGISWDNGSFAAANQQKDHDKQWLYVSPDGTILMGWTEFDKYGSKDTSDRSRILFSSSVDEGSTWKDAVIISGAEGDCLDGDGTTEGAHPVVGTDGTYYMVWGHDNQLLLDKSLDKGKTWQKKDEVLVSQPGGWSYEIPGIDRCNGMPVMDCDHSKSAYRGNLYVSWSDQRNGADDTDIWIMVSSDNAKTWSLPRRVNNDGPGKHQFFSWMDIDQTTGYIYIVFYDRRNHTDNHTDVYLAYSSDGGQHFENIKISETPFLPEPYLFFGDYNDISAWKGKIRPIWTRQDKEVLSVQTAILDVKRN